jgi:hypothetical protein
MNCSLNPVRDLATGVACDWPFLLRSDTLRLSYWQANEGIGPSHVALKGQYDSFVSNRHSDSSEAVNPASMAKRGVEYNIIVCAKGHNCKVRYPWDARYESCDLRKVSRHGKLHLRQHDLAAILRSSIGQQSLTMPCSCDFA